MVRVFNYNTLERVTQFTAHSDYIRGLIVHPTRPLILSCSDDLSIKAWDWEKGWKQVAIFEGHSNYVMGIALNPKDSNTFASASLDQTIKVIGMELLQLFILLLFLYICSDLELELINFRGKFSCCQCNVREAELHDGRPWP